MVPRPSTSQAVSLRLLEEQLSHCMLHAARSGGPEADIKLKVASATSAVTGARVADAG